MITKLGSTGSSLASGRAAVTDHLLDLPDHLLELPVRIDRVDGGSVESEPRAERVTEADVVLRLLLVACRASVTSRGAERWNTMSGAGMSRYKRSSIRASARRTENRPGGNGRWASWGPSGAPLASE